MTCLVNPYRFGGGTPTDPDFASVVLLMGADAGFVDESSSAKTVTNSGVSQSTTNPKFGSHCFVLAANDQMSLADHADWAFGSGDFTIELWARFDANNLLYTLLNKSTSSPRSWRFNYNGAAATDVLTAEVSNGAGGSFNIIASGNWTPTTNTWYHLCMERAGGTLRNYVDGVVNGTIAVSGSLTVSTATLLIGNDGGSNDFNGGMDEIRITKGVARYNGAFTPPTQAYPRS